jgi:MYXO-CTERM domain-containing protein
VESVDVSFLDPGAGQIQKRTKFSFKVTRGHGYEAGEYEVTIKDGRTDSAIGTKVRLVFEGENEVIDRRAMVFSGEKKKKKDEDKGDGDGEPKSEKKQITEDDPAFWAGGPKSDTDTSDQEVDPKRGCGCRVEGKSAGSDALGASLLGLALAAAFMRRSLQNRGS